ncbi:metallophosphoesterase [Bradyrhizobium sp. SSBR45G]|nr:metallophosphoesterase [Bradyrhizobium sp. SSBR45G]GLH83528.1 metallophosphoesterase [Bradyrhizobium sp. SSBR45R]
MSRMRGSENEEAEQEDVCIYAVGDIHGRLDLLSETFFKIDADIESSKPRRWIEVFVGDYVDRGADSFSVIEALAERARAPHVVCLRGNHEQILLNFLEDPGVLKTWRQYGAIPTLQSYGLNPSANPDLDESFLLAEQLRQTMPSSHLQFLQTLPTSFSFGSYFFAHAGIRPGVPLPEQQDQDLMWIREEFLLCDDNFGKMIVHGHTPARDPEVLHNRINIDTGAYATGRLTCARIEGRRVGFL